MRRSGSRTRRVRRASHAFNSASRASPSSPGGACRVRPEPPPVVGHRDVGVVRERSYEPLERGVEPPAQERGRLAPVGGQPRTVEERVPLGLPVALRHKEVGELPEPLAPGHGDVPAPDPVAERREHGGLVRPPVDPPVPLDVPAAGLRERNDVGGVRGHPPLPSVVHRAEHGHGLHERAGLGRAARRVHLEVERVQERRREPPEVREPVGHARERGRHR